MEEYLHSNLKMPKLTKKPDLVCNSRKYSLEKENMFREDIELQSILNKVQRTMKSV